MAFKKGELTKSLKKDGWKPFENRTYEIKDNNGNVKNVRYKEYKNLVKSAAKDYEYNKILEVPITSGKSIKIRNGIKNKLDSIAKADSIKDRSERARRMDELIEKENMSDDERNAAQSYAGIKKLELASTATGKDGAFKEITQPIVKFLAGTRDAAESAARFFFKDGMKIDGDYTQAYNAEKEYYEKNPDALGNDLFDTYTTSLSTPKGEYLRNIGVDKILEAYNDTNKLTRFISDVGFRSFGQMAGDAALVSMSGLGGAANAVKKTADIALNGSKMGKAVSKAAEIAPKIKTVSGNGAISKAVNAGIKGVNNISVGKALGFINPFDNPTTALMGISAAQNKYDSLKQMGYDSETAKKSALFSGYVSAITEKMGYNGTPESFYFIPGKVVSGDLSASKLRNIGTAINKYTKANISEGIEEIYNTVFDRMGDYLNKIGYVDESGEIKQRKLYGNEGIIDARNIGESFLGGFVGGAVMGAAGFINGVFRISKSDMEYVKRSAEYIKEKTAENNKTVEDLAKKAGMTDFKFPVEPDWKNATVDEIADYTARSTQNYKDILNDTNVKKNDSAILKKAEAFTDVNAETQKNKDAVSGRNSNVPETAVKTNTGSELDEIMSGEPITAFAPETASGEIKRLENILIERGTDDTSRKEIVDTAVEIEKNLNGSGKNVRSVFDDVSNITSSVMREIKSQVGASSAYWKLFGENLKNVPKGNVRENVNLVTEYSNAYAQALKNNNPEKYDSAMLSADGKDMSGELPQTIMEGVMPRKLKDAGKYRLIASNIKNIINAADIQLENERKGIYGENVAVPVENNAETVETQTVAEPKNITLTRMGDFYEAYGNDALELAEKLNLTPTYKTINGVKNAMVGVPVHALEKYQSILGNDYNLILSDDTTAVPVGSIPIIGQNSTDIVVKSDETVQNSDVTTADDKNESKPFTQNELRTLMSDRPFFCTVKNLNYLGDGSIFVKCDKAATEFVKSEYRRRNANSNYDIEHNEGIGGKIERLFAESKELAKAISPISYKRDNGGRKKTDNAYVVGEYAVLFNRNYANIIKKRSKDMKIISNGSMSGTLLTGYDADGNIAGFALPIFAEGSVTNKDGKSVPFISKTDEKRSLATAENANALSSTPETTGSTASGSIVSQDNDTVNSSVRKNNENDTLNLTDKCELYKSKHTKTGDDIWVVTLKERLSAEDYRNLKSKVKAVGGYYSNFTKTLDGKSSPGFLFKAEPTEKELSVFNNFFNETATDETPQAESFESTPNNTDVVSKPEEVLKKEPESGIIKKNPTTQIAEYVTNKLANGEKITAPELSKISSKAFGGTMADNAYNIKDAYDAMELGVNKYILSMKDVSAEKMLELLELLPTQTKRTEEMVKYQQFSTPPSIAYLANYAANVNSKDIMLEPSAGIGGIAVFAKRDGATVYVNELDNRRLEILKNMPFDKFFNENAEQLDNILGGEIEPSVIVMNPPFSSSSERNIQNTKIGAKHIEQALKILAPNGRLVAIVGHGMGDGAPAFRNWWKGIKSQYNVKANIRINGKNYNKYGTNFDIQMLVIDKNGATAHTETGYVDTLQELQKKLEVIRDERPVFDYSRNEQGTIATTRSETVETGKSGLLGKRTVSDNSGIADNRSDTGNVGDAQGVGRKSELPNVRKPDEPIGGSADEVAAKSDVVADEQGDNGNGRVYGVPRRGDNGLRDIGRTDGNTGMERSEQSGIHGNNGTTRTGQNNVRGQRLKKKELTDNIFEQYRPQPLKLKGAKPHPASVSESAAMNAIEPPPITYKPNIPQSIVENGTLSDVQLEAISYAGQSNSQTLPDKKTRGFLLGDGTGIGKGRTIAGIILDNYNQGRKKALWVTLNASLVNDAKRDVKAVFGNSDLVTQFVGGKKADKVLSKDEAVMVISYDSLSKGYENRGSNFEKLISWLGKDFDGVIVFDESHKMGNATTTKGKRGKQAPSKAALAGIALQKALPKAKIVYSSATAATEVENLRYAERLGLWGEGTAFATGDDFVSKIKAGGLAAMELIARDMKAMGVYLSRNISYEDVRYDKITHKLSQEQKKIYDELARSWQIVLSNMNKALECTNQAKDGKARGNALGAFWNSQQRFFNQILTSMQVPSVISDIEKQLSDGKSCVIQLVSTNESAQNEEMERIKSNGLELDEFDLTPKQMLMSYIENSFPVQQYEEYRDDEGNVRSKPVFDSKGNPVLNRDAVRQREELLSKLGSIKVPSSPIDMIINHFGTDMVAENTGRVRRVIQKDGKLVEEKIGSKKDADVDAFQNGKKRIIIFSKAGGTGKSYHADRAAKNQQQRVHYLLEAGWQADNAVQGFGRSHRSNQAVAPIFKLVTTDLKGQMRFISTIAKRLDQLGAMTKGQRQAGGQGMFSASDNLENSLAQDVLAGFYKDLIFNRVDGINDGLEIISKLGLDGKLLDKYNRIKPTAPELREVNKFLNRILSLESSEQNTVFDGYQQRLQDATEKAAAAGTLDKGLENYKADKITLNEVKDIREDERTGAKTKYYNLTAEHKIKPVKFEDIPKSDKFVGYYQNKTTGNVRAAVRTSSTTDQYGNVTDNFKLIGQVKNDYITQNRFNNNWNEIRADEAEKLWNEEMAKLPEYRKESLHLISGVVLPVWDKLPTENVRIYRVLTSDGEMLIGRVIPEDRIDEVLRRLGSSRKKEKIATKDLISGIKNGDTVYLDNDWKIVQRKVSGENRIEIVGPTYENYDSLTKKGVFTERIQYNTRYFVPADTNTEKIVDEILKISPVMRVENAKYSISESEDLSNEQTGNGILSGNSGRTIDESAGKQAKRVSSYKQRLEGQTQAERKSAAKELAVKNYTEEIISGNHKYTLIKEDGYNDDMRSIVLKAKGYGKEVGFFIGNAVRKFDGQRNFKIDGIKLSDNKILIRYDGTYSPQALLMHELVHTEWDNPEMQKAKDIILSDLSENDKKEILRNGRYKDYMELYDGNEDAVWEEFIADVFADMNNYSDDYIDTAVDYWYNDKVIDRYNPAEYIKSMDTGGNEKVLDNIGFGNDYSLSGNSFDVPYNEKRQLDDYVLRKNHSSDRLKKVDCKEIGNNFYVWENNSKTDYDVVFMVGIDGNEDFIDFVRGETKNGTFRTGESIRKAVTQYNGRFGSGNRRSVDDARRRKTSGNGSVAGGVRADNGRGNIAESGGNKQTKYSLNSYETDAESLTPERKKAIFEQWERDHAGVEKPTLRQVWGERAQWVAHNVARVFPNIPERGEKGTFFAEFRKNMIQWKNLPTTASIMVQDKLNKMTVELTPDEYKIFSELVYFLDLQEEAQIQKDRGYDEILLPNEITPKEVDEIVNILNGEATNKVQQALIKRQNIWDELKQQYIDLNSYIGFETDGKFKRRNYYHHQVIDYMNKDKGGIGNREIGIKAGRGWLKERQGSTKAINTDFLAVEYKSMLQMQYDVYIAETLGKIKQKYDIKPKLEKDAFENNKKALNDIIQKECTDKDGNIMLDNKGKPDSETYRKQKWYNARIMWGFNGLFDLAERGELNDYDGEYANVVKAFKKHDLNVSGLYKYIGILSNIELPDNATDGQEQAVQNARTVLKYTAKKKAWIKKLLANDYQTWETIAKSMSDTHTIHQPRRGNYFYTKTILDEDAFNKAHEDMVLSLVSGEVDLGNVDVAKLFEQYSDTVRLTGAAYEQWVLPKEIVATMAEIANPKQVRGGLREARAIVSAWKGWATSVNPLRTIKFGLRNLGGDLDAVIAGNPKVVLYSNQAVQEIYQAMRHKNYSDEFMEWVRRGGYTSMIFVNEMDTEMQNKLFSHLKGKQGTNIFKIPAKAFEKYYNGVENVHNFREAILRYSAYLYFKNEINKNGGNVKDYVASNRYIVKGLDSVEDKAYQLSKDLLGAYDEVGKLGQTLRRYWVPFYSFTETNMKRYFRMFENIIMSDDEIPKKAGKLLLKALMTNMLMLIIIAWNKLVMKEQDDKLPPSPRDVPHITLGQIGDNVYAFRQLGSFSELLEWVGLDDYKWTKEDLTAPVDKAWGMITPFVKMPVELASGLNFYPSLTHPRAIRDKWQHFFNSLGVDSVYNEVTGKPTKGAGEILKDSFIYNYDYKESAYYEILDIKREWQDDDNGSIYKPTPKSNALYYMKTAVRYKDKKAAMKYLDKYFENGGTGKGIKQSFATLNPMYGFTTKATMAKGNEFIASLSDEEKEKLKIAQDFYENDLMLPQEVLSRLGKKDITDEEAKNLLRNYINAKCK